MYNLFDNHIVISQIHLRHNKNIYKANKNNLDLCMKIYVFVISIDCNYTNFATVNIKII